MEHGPIVDADGHVLEPPTGMAERAPAKFRDRIWQIVTRPDGSEWLRYNGGERPANGLALAGVGGMSAADRERARRGEMKYTEVRAGAFRPLPRLVDMDADGIEQAVLYPTLLVGLHPFLAPDMPGACRALGFYALKAEGVEMARSDPASPIRHMANIFFSQAISNPFDMMETLSVMICGGVLERFPRLRLIFLEANGGWIVPWLERLDHHYEVFRWDVPWLRMKPSEYFRRQCWISFDPDESALPFPANSPLVGAERIVWASDYPHPDAKFPGTTAELTEAIAPLDAEQQAQIAGKSAMALYGLR